MKPPAIPGTIDTTGQEDEGYQDDYPPEFPFWYGGNSGPMSFTHQIPVSSPLISTCPTIPNSGISHRIGKLDKHGRPNSYKDQDSCLHYFIATTQSEQILDEYMTGIIKSFLCTAGPIHARLSVSDQDAITSDPKIPTSSASSLDLEQYLYTLKTNLIDKATRTAAPQMIGHMTTALPYFHRPLARLLTALNQNVVKVETSSTFTLLERQTIAMLHNSFYEFDELFYTRFAHSPAHCLGVICSGGTIANISALWMARNKALGPRDDIACKGVHKEGLISCMLKYQYAGAVIIGSEMMHYSFRKAADILGIGEQGLCLIPTDDQFCMRYYVLIQD